MPIWYWLRGETVAGPLMLGGPAVVPPTSKSVEERLVPSFAVTTCEDVKPFGTLKVGAALPLPSVVTEGSYVAPNVMLTERLGPNPVRVALTEVPAGPLAWFSCISGVTLNGVEATEVTVLLPIVSLI